MRRDYVIAILLAISALPAGMAIAMAPLKWEHLPPWIINLCFYGGIGLTSALIISAVLVALHGEKSDKNKPKGYRMIAVVGMIVFGAGFLTCAGWYYLYTPDTTIDSAVIKLPIATSNINKPSFGRFAALDDNYIPNPNKDNPIFSITDVFITNSSLTKSITIIVRLIVRAGFIPDYMPFDNNGKDSFGRKLQLNAGRIISPLTLRPQETVGGYLPFIIPFSWGNEFDKNILESLLMGSLTNKVKFTLEIEDVISGQKISIQLPGRYQGE
jgi:hypothetical protein